MDMEDMESHSRASTGLPGRATVVGKGESGEIDPGLQTLFDLCNRARDLMDDPKRDIINIDMLADDLEAYIKWCSVPLQDMVRQVLENPKELIPEHVCPTLVEVMRQLQRNEYKSKRLRHLHAHVMTRENREELSKYTAKLELQIVSLVSQMAKARNERANPPWIVMRSIDRLYHGTSESDWEGLTRERLLVDRTGLRRAMRAVKGWRPEPSFATEARYERDSVSTSLAPALGSLPAYSAIARSR